MKILFTNYTFDLYNSGNSEYYEHIPFYVYSVLETQPNAFVKIHINTKLNQNIKDALSILTNTNFEIVEDFDILKYNKNYDIRETRFYKSVRWLLTKEVFDGFDCGYIGDVDFLIYKEEKSIMESHLEHCEKIGLPFSNGIRPKGKQMTGLHFIKCKEYFEKMENVISNAIETNLIDEIKNIQSEYKRDEHILYELVRQGFDFSEIETQITDGNELYYRPHHGVHLGIMRMNDEYGKSCHKPHYLDFAEFRELFKIVPNEQIRKTIKHFEND